LLHADVGAFNSSEDVKKVALANFSDASLGAKPAAIKSAATATATSLERVADVPIYHADPLVRRGKSLHASAYGKQARVRMNAETATQFGLTHGAPVRVEQGGHAIVASLAIDEAAATGTVRVPFATEVSAALGSAVDPITVSAV
jgi:NADH-quinone oxidoreductase subunit G